MKITLIKPGLGNVNKAYNLNEGSMEPLQLAIIAGLVEAPDKLILYDDRIEKIQFDDPTDLVCITVDSITARRAYEIAREYRNRGKKVVLGGMHVTLIPDEALQHADTVVIGDVEPVWKTLINDFKSGQLQSKYTAPFGIPQDGCIPDREIFKNKNYLPISLVQFSRGCKLDCSFCSVSKFFHHSHKCRKIDDVLYEIDKNKLKTILFVDDNMAMNKEELKFFLKELIPMKVKWASQSGIDMVNDKELLKLMVDSGCVGNLIGFDSIDVNTLKWFNKSLNLSGFNYYEKELQLLREYGLLTWASFMLGNDFDTPETIEKTVEFAIKNKFSLAYFHILMPYPGTKIYDQFKSENRLLYDGTWWNHPDYSYNKAAYIPKNFEPDTLTEAVKKANTDFYKFSSITHRLFDTKTNLKDLFSALLYLRFNSIIKKTST